MEKIKLEANERKAKSNRKNEGWCCRWNERKAEEN